MGIIIGLTGLAGAGKDTVAEALEDLAAGSGYSVRTLRLSDVLRAELHQRDAEGEESRLALITLGNALRDQYGEGVLAERILGEIHPHAAHLHLVSGMRTPGEVAALRRAFAGRFVLIGVETVDALRTARILTRAQYHEDSQPVAGVDQADQDIGIHATLALADVTIRNNGSLDDLKAVVQSFFLDTITPLLLDE